jgi:hypothetical protein
MIMIMIKGYLMCPLQVDLLTGTLKRKSLRMIGGNIE